MTDHQAPRTRWASSTDQHTCPVCGLLHAVPAGTGHGAEVRAFRAKLGRVLRLPAGRMLDQVRAAHLLGCTSRQLSRYETGEVLMPVARAERMRELQERLASADSVRLALGERLAKRKSPPRRKRNPPQFNNF